MHCYTPFIHEGQAEFFKVVSKGSCKDNIDTGDKINLEKFPVPHWHHLDGGRFIGTLGAVITRDPETGIRNMAAYRQQMLGKNKVGLLTSQQSCVHLQKYMAMNKPMPVATAIGVQPEVLSAATVQAPYGEDELGIAGEPTPLVKSETVDLANRTALAFIPCVLYDSPLMFSLRNVVINPDRSTGCGACHLRNRPVKAYVIRFHSAFSIHS